ncbi:RDD family protein [Streptomyces sp. CC224B]|uniref:RDD family protein n=1 Tax=Streptomyces sp. CC224B TaxID=3044571 RepID=UPI0024A7B741|nr:RDD family protein [Streptomyces sp. CC224B]
MTKQQPTPASTAARALPGQAPAAPPPGPAPSAPRRITGAVIDALLALVCGAAAGAAVGIKVVDGVAELRLAPATGAAALAGAVAFSLVNHVLLTAACRASLGKLLTGLRVVRAADGGWPGLARLTGRWVFGFYWAVVAVPLHVASDSDVQQQDAVGLRVVRRPA